MNSFLSYCIRKMFRKLDRYSNSSEIFSRRTHGVRHDNTMEQKTENANSEVQTFYTDKEQGNLISI